MPVKLIFFQSHETFLVLCLYFQPIFFCFLFFLFFKRGLLYRTLFLQVYSARRRYKTLRFFECAAYARQLSNLQLDLPVLALAVLYVIYDVDVLFFFIETTM